MNHCWPDGDLRAYLDGEVTVDARESIDAHLEACPACTARYRELSERAAWVSAVMALSESRPPVSAARWRPHRWRVAAVALAAVLAIAFVMLPKHAPVRPARIAKVVAPAPTAEPAAVRPVVRRRAPRPPTPGEEFLRLDDEPIETATLVRVSADNGALQADLIVGPDGRAHAIRIVRNR
jgi:anti-sigma factor RsiW